MFKYKFPNYIQYDSTDCGPTCLKIISKYYGKYYNIDFLRNLSYENREGVSMQDIASAAEKLGFKNLSVKLSYKHLDKISLPCIAYIQQSHFVVIYKIKKNTIYVSDPAYGLTKYKLNDFSKVWESGDISEGVLLLLEPGEHFFDLSNAKIDDNASTSETKLGFQFLYKYLIRYKKYFVQIFILLLAGSTLNLVFPFLTQLLVDVGIEEQNLNFISLILISQLAIFIGQALVEFVRSWIILHVSTRINISVLSDFLVKLMKLPISFFEKKMMGDIIQRISDNTRIQNFLANSSLSILFSFLNLVVYGIILFLYNFKIFLVFLFGSSLSIMWIFLFLNRRRELNFKSFRKESQSQTAIIEIITGIQEIKINNCEGFERKKWEANQADLFKLNSSLLALTQYQSGGTLFLNQLKNILISFIAANEVVNGNITLGMMLSITYIIGQLNSPIEQSLGFIQTAQDAKLSIDRIGEIQNRKNEQMSQFMDNLLDLDRESKISIKNLSFRYSGPNSPLVINNLNLVIQEGKVTAIVGPSGSGKTTLIKLLLYFYHEYDGDILIGKRNVKEMNISTWRTQCGVVMQDGFIFADDILKNITLSDQEYDKNRFIEAIEVANIRSFIESLPKGYKTKIGIQGIGLSAGQRQRILIARAIYKNPQFLFFDEATSALDANNEKKIMKNLEYLYKNKTVLIIAHRLSTVKKADNIVVLDNGSIIEQGTHDNLTQIKGVYYNLIKNQLEMGN